MTTSIFDERTKRGDNTQILKVRYESAARYTSEKNLSPSQGAKKSKEIVFRVLNKVKHKNGSLAQFRYISRTNRLEYNYDGSKQTNIYLENEAGERLSDRRSIDNEFNSWELSGGIENRSPYWLKAGEKERLLIDKQWKESTAEWRKKNSKLDPYKKVQSLHVIVSIPHGNAESLRKAVRAAAQDAFRGHRYVFAIHSDHDRGPHAHIIIKNSNELNGRSLAIRKNDIESYRVKFYEYSKQEGIDVTCSRRVDRLANEIRNGEEPFHSHDRSRGRYIPGQRIKDKAPNWHAAYMDEFNDRLANFPDQNNKKPFWSRWISKSPENSPEFKEIIPNFRHYQNPTQSAMSYLAMRAESPGLADWIYRNQPKAFGTPVAEPGFRPDARLAKSAGQAVYASLYDRKPRYDRGAEARRKQLKRDAAHKQVQLSTQSFSERVNGAGEELARQAAARANAAKKGEVIMDFKLPAQSKKQMTPSELIKAYKEVLAKIELSKKELNTAKGRKAYEFAVAQKISLSEKILNNDAAKKLAMQDTQIQKSLKFTPGLSLG